MTDLNTVHHLNTLLESGKPQSVLDFLNGETTPEVVAFKARALIELDQYDASRKLIENQLDELSGAIRFEAEILWSHSLIRYGQVDDALLTLRSVFAHCTDPILKSEGIALSAIGYAKKRCWVSAENAIIDALKLSPLNPKIYASRGRMLIEADRRIEAQGVYQELEKYPQVWAQLYGLYGQGHIAYLLGEFDKASELSNAALNLSREFVYPLFVLGKIAAATNDRHKLASVIEELKVRSPYAEGLRSLEDELKRISFHNPKELGLQHRLTAFPSLIQRRDYCGPSTIELVIRYWENGFGMTNDQIAEIVKHPQGGTPIYQIRSFFQLAGYDTLRAIVDINKLKILIDEGIPVIVQQTFSNTSHVVVVIGYDEHLGVIELQDPMTHQVVQVDYKSFEDQRKFYADSAIIAFPGDRGYRQLLAQHHIYDHPSIEWTDQSVREFDRGNYSASSELANNAVSRLTEHGLSWLMLLHSEFETWRTAFSRQNESWVNRNGEPLPELFKTTNLAKDNFIKTLRWAKEQYGEAAFIYSMEGSAAILENDIQRGLESFILAEKMNPGDARIHAHLAECYFLLNRPTDSFKSVRKSLEIDPSLAVGNVWMARCLAVLKERGAEYYARAAVELSGEWWLTHQVLAEVLFPSQIEATQSALEKALLLNPGYPDSLILHAELAITQNDIASARKDLEAIQVSHQRVAPFFERKRRRIECQILNMEEKYSHALERVQDFLNTYPDDPWGLHFFATLTLENLIHSDPNLETAKIYEITQNFEYAVLVNDGDIKIVDDYLNVLFQLGWYEECHRVVIRWAGLFPEHGAILFLFGQVLFKLNLMEQAVDLTLRALSKPDSVKNRNELYQAVQILVHGLGPQKAHEALILLEIPANGLSVSELERSLGLVLANGEYEAVELSRSLLEKSYNLDVDDYQVIFNLGKLSHALVDQERLFRQSLLVNPDWNPSREALVELLLEQQRTIEAENILSGYEEVSEKLLLLNAQCLFKLGFYEQSAQKYAQANLQQTDPNANHLFAQWQAEMSSGWHHQAISTAKYAVKNCQDTGLWRFRLAISFLESGRIQAAYRELDRAKLIGLPLEKEICADYQFAFAQGLYNEAFEYLEHLNQIRDDPVNQGSLCWNNRQKLILMLRMEETEAFADYLNTLQLTGKGLGEAALIAFEEGYPELAYELASQSISVDADNFPGLIAIAQSLEEMDYRDQAQSAFMDLIEKHPEQHKPFERMALFYLWEGQLNLALDYADRAIRLGASCTQAWAVRGLVFFMLDQGSEAMIDLQIAMDRHHKTEYSYMTIFWMAYFALQGKMNEVNKLISRLQPQNEKLIPPSFFRKIRRYFEVDGEIDQDFYD